MVLSTRPEYPCTEPRPFSYEEVMGLALPVKRKRLTQAEKREILEAAREELSTGHTMTLRQVHYRLVARGRHGLHEYTKGLREPLQVAARCPA